VFLCFVGAFVIRDIATTNLSEFYLNFGAWPDQGAQFLFVSWLKMLVWLNPQHRNSLDDLHVFQAAVVSVFSIVMLLPRLPWLLLVGGQVALVCAWWVFGDISAHCHAIEAWVIIFSAMFVVVLAYWRGGWRDYIVAIMFGVVLGYMPLMRQSASGTFLMPFATIALFGAIAAVLDACRRRWSREALPQPPERMESEQKIDSIQTTARSERLFLKHAAPVLLLVASFLAVRHGADWMWFRVYQQRIMPHGVGWSFALSLGWVNNVHNVVCDDYYAIQQGLFIDKEPFKVTDPMAYEKLGQVWREHVVEDPMLLVRGCFEKSHYLLGYFSGTFDPLEHQSDELPNMPSWITLMMGLAFCGASVFLCKQFWRARSSRMMLLSAGTIGLLASGFLVPVVILPYRLQSVIAFILASVFILSPAVYLIARDEAAKAVDLNIHRNTWVYRLLGILALLPLIPFSAYTAYRSVVNHAEARELLHGDPLEKFQQLGLHFSYRFNRLSHNEQQTVMNHLLAPRYNDRVLRTLSSQDMQWPRRIFAPQLALVGDGILCVVARLSQDWKMPLPSYVCGPKNSTLLWLKNADRNSGVWYQFDLYYDSYHYLGIHDKDWDGGYHMYCLPAPPDIAEGLQFIGVSAHNIRGGNENASLNLDLISGDRLYRGDRLPP